MAVGPPGLLGPGKLLVAVGSPRDVGAFLYNVGLSCPTSWHGEPAAAPFELAIGRSNQGLVAASICDAEAPTSAASGAAAGATRDAPADADRPAIRRRRRPSESDGDKACVAEQEQADGAIDRVEDDVPAALACDDGHLGRSKGPGASPISTSCKRARRFKASGDQASGDVRRCSDSGSNKKKAKQDEAGVIPGKILNTDESLRRVPDPLDLFGRPTGSCSSK